MRNKSLLQESVSLSYKSTAHNLRLWQTWQPSSDDASRKINKAIYPLVESSAVRAGGLWLQQRPWDGVRRSSGRRTTLMAVQTACQNGRLRLESMGNLGLEYP